MIECNFSVQSLSGCKNATNASFNNTSGSYNHEKYKDYVNNKFLYKEYKASVGARAVSFAHFESDRRSVRTRFAGTVKKRFLLFIQDYRNNKSNVNGSADSVEEVHAADTGKWAVIYKNGSAGFDTAIHEAAHTMGLQHTFNSYNTKKVYYKEPLVSRSWVKTNVFPTGDPGLYFVKRAAHAKQLYRQGNTENIMDYTWFVKFNLNDKTDFLKIAPPTGTSYNDLVTNKIHYGAFSKKSYYKIPTSASGRNIGGRNSNDRISFYKWQWKLLQLDDEIVNRALTLTIPHLPSNDIKLSPPVEITATLPNITKS